MNTSKRLRCLVAMFCMLLAGGTASAGVTFFIDDVVGFNNAVAIGGFGFAGREDFESSVLPPNMLVSIPDPIAPGVPNAPFLTGTNPATGLTVQSNTLGGNPVVPQPGGGIATASVGAAGTPTDQVSNNLPGASFDMLFGLPNTTAVSFIPLVFDPAASGNPGTVDIRVYDTTNLLLGSMLNVGVTGFTNPTTFAGVVAMPGDDIGRINVFATSVNDLFSGADDIDVYTSSATGVPAPPTIILIGVGLIGTALHRRRRRST